MKIARNHILHMVEYALEAGGPVTYQFAKYTMDATPYREPGKRGHSGVRVTWRKNPEPEKKVVKTKKPSAKKSAKKKKARK